MNGGVTADFQATATVKKLTPGMKWQVTYQPPQETGGQLQPNRFYSANPLLPDLAGGQDIAVFISDWHGV